MKKNMFIILLLFGASQNSLSREIICQPESQLEDKAYVVKCKDSVASEFKGVVPSVLRLNGLGLANGERLNLNNLKLFDLVSKEYLNGDLARDSLTVNELFLNESAATVYSDASFSRPIRGCVWRNQKVRYFESESCNLCMGTAFCNWGNGTVQARLHCGAINVNGTQVCPSATECFADKAVQSSFLYTDTERDIPTGRDGGGLNATSR